MAPVHSFLSTTTLLVAVTVLISEFQGLNAFNMMHPVRQGNLMALQMAAGGEAAAEKYC